jgi:predicted ArsR family transcriptional regulator
MKEYSLSDTSDSVTAIIAYTIRAMNNCGFSKMQIDRYIKMIKSLNYNQLVDLSNSILSSCNDYIKDLYNYDNMNRKKLEARIAKLEKALKNEGYDISADVYNWFNKYCCDILDKDKSFGWKYLKEELEDADASIYADECLIDLAAEQGISPDDLEDYRDQIEYDLEKLVEDALDYIEYGDTDLTFDKNNADWMDRYRDNVEYTASLESRISRLEKKLKNENISLNTFDCEALLKILENNIKSTGAKADIADDNADYGFVSIAIYNPDYVTDYDIIADKFDSFEVNNEDKSVGKAKSFEEIGKLIADHYKENFV